jgi:DNA-binding MarR family transcriptional regulator
MLDTQQAQPASPQSDDPAALAAALRMVLGRLWRRLRAENGFPLTQGAVLARLEREGPQSTAELAAAERVRPQSMGQTVAELEVQGLISRHPDPSDGRRVLLELTDDGRAALGRDRQRREGWLASAIDQSTDEAERRALARAIVVLERLGEM